MNKLLLTGLVVLTGWLLISAITLLVGLSHLAAFATSKPPSLDRVSTANSWLELTSLLTLNSIPDLEFVTVGLELVTNNHTTLAELASLRPNLSHLDLSKLSNLDQLDTEYQQLAEKCAHTLLIKNLTHNCQSLVGSSQLLQQLSILTPWLQRSTPTTILVLLQNNDELRAGGGFMGSLLVATFQDGSLTQPIRFIDAYDIAGLIEPIQPAPPGAEEFLSGGQGLSWVDANWSPDFTQTTATLTSQLEDTEFASTLLVIGVTTQLVEDMLAITGPLLSPDTNQYVTAENIATILRQDRDRFFAGSNAKTNLLQAVAFPLVERLQSLSWSEQLKLISLVPGWFEAKTIQLSSSDNEFFKDLSKTYLASTLSIPNHVQPLIWIENNVGINKANQAVTRSVEVTSQSPRVVKATAKISNTNPVPLNRTEDNDLVYLNYQRIWVEPTWEVESININGRFIDQAQLQRRPVTTASGRPLQEFAFLVAIPEQTTSLIEVLLQTPSTVTELWWWKQPGVGAYQLVANDQAVEVRGDVVLDL